MNDSALRTGRPRGRPPKAAPSQFALPLTRTPRRCLGFGEEHYFMSSGPGHRRCPNCEDRFKKLPLGMRFERVAEVPKL